MKEEKKCCSFFNDKETYYNDNNICDIIELALNDLDNMIPELTKLENDIFNFSMTNNDLFFIDKESSQKILIH